MDGALILVGVIIIVMGQIVVAYINRNKSTMKCDCHHEFETDEDLEVEEDNYDYEIPFSDNQIEVNLKTPASPHHIQTTDLEHFIGVKRISQVFPESTDLELSKIHVVYVDSEHYDAVFETLERLASLDESHDFSGVESVHRIPKRSIG